MTSSLPARFWAKVDKAGPGGCWLWTGGHSRGRASRYGQFYMNGRHYRAHRLSFADAVRPLRPGEVVDHKCYVTSCVNPAHLQAVTPRENSENLPGPRRGTVSGVRGVSWNRGTHRWQVQVGSRGRLNFGGYFHDLAAASAAAVALRNRLMTNNLADLEVRDSDSRTGRTAT